MAKRFYYKVMGEMFGPLSGVELRDKAMAGDVTTDTLVRINEEGDWVLAARLKNLFDERGLPISHSAILGPPPRPQPDQAAPEGNSPATDSSETEKASDSSSDGIDFRPDASEANTVADLPDLPALYALYGGRGDGLYPAFVGITDDLKTRIEQHLVRSDSRAVGETAAISVNPQYVTEVRWWTNQGFTQKLTMEAALLVAYDFLEPVVRSELGITDGARKLYKDSAYVARMREMFKQPPAGHLVIRSLDDAWAEIDAQAARLAELEQRLVQLEGE